MSDFTIDDETWKVYNEPSGGAPSLPIVWSSTGGNPGGYIVANSWVNKIVPLTDVAGWKYGESIAGGAPAATAAQILAILSDVNKIRIRAEFSGLTYETNGLDNVLMTCGFSLPVELLEF
ncbi:MAG: hypothetical protein IPO03_06130 [Bacteroidetes bacterium]|nr:hypothetical protein [Bacteroidota bacterium]